MYKLVSDTPPHPLLSTASLANLSFPPSGGVVCSARCGRGPSGLPGGRSSVAQLCCTRNHSRARPGQGGRHCEDHSHCRVASEHQPGAQLGAHCAAHTGSCGQELCCPHHQDLCCSSSAHFHSVALGLSWLGVGLVERGTSQRIL